MKRIILEGMDATGKTTLIQDLRKEFHVLTPPIINELGPAQDFETWWPMTLNDDPHPFVPLHDRFFYSEIVYGIIIRGFVKAPMPVVNRVGARLKNEALLIYCRPGLNTIMEHLDDQPQMSGVKSKWRELLEYYDTIMLEAATEYSPDRWTFYDWREPTAKKRIFNLVERYLET